MYTCSAVPAEPGSSSNCPCWRIFWTALTGRSLRRRCQTHVPSLNPMPPSGRAPTGRSLFLGQIWIHDPGQHDVLVVIPRSGATRNLSYSWNESAPVRPGISKGTSPSSPLARTAGTASYPAALTRPAERPGTSQRTGSHPEPRTDGRRNTMQWRGAITAVIRRRHIRSQPEATSVTLWIDALDRPAWQILHVSPFLAMQKHRSPWTKCLNFAASRLWCQAKTH